MSNNPFEKSIDNFGSFQGNDYSEERKKYLEILKNIDLIPLEESGINMPDSDITENFDDIFNIDFEAGKSQYNTNLKIKKLGRPKKCKGDNNGKNDNIASAVKMAHILAAYEEDITISVISSCDNCNMNTDFFISSSSETDESLKSMIRAAYGKAETELINTNREFDLAPIYAKGEFILKDKKERKEFKEQDYNKFESWISSVLDSMSGNGNYRVNIRFYPIDSDSEIATVKNKIQQLNQLYKKLKFYSEMNWSNSTTIGINDSIQKKALFDQFQDKLKLKKINGYSNNLSSAYSLGSKDTNKKYSLLVDEIEYEISRLKQGFNSKLWAVSISIEANDTETQQSIAAILSGTMIDANINLNWGEDKCTAVIGSTQDILPFMFFPTKEFCGFEFVENEEFSLVSPVNSDNGFNIGNILWNDEPISDFCLPQKALNRHAFICGMTGAGKTNTLFNIIENINTPFLVIEPVKGEYRSLKSEYNDMNIWTMKTGDDSENTRIMQINPFWFPNNSNLAFHIDSIKTILASAFELTAAMPNILEQCLYNVYVKSGWNLVTNKNRYVDELPEEFLYPTFSDLCTEIEIYLDESDFGPETLGDYKGALLTRLRSFINGFKGILLNTNEHPDYEKLIKGRNVIELDGLADDADKCLVMGTILVQYFESLKLSFNDDDRNNPLKHIIVIEEAHRLFKNVKKNQNQEGADPAGQLVETLSNIMAEIRAFGEGMLIVDQSPTKIAEDVIKNSATKIIHRIDNEKDIKILQASLLIPDDITSIPSLKQGEALIRTDSMTRPCKVKIYRSDTKETYSLSSSFQKSTSSNYDLECLFAATSILYDASLCEKLKELILDFLSNLYDNNTDIWYSVISEFVKKIFIILIDYKSEDVVGNLDILLNMILLTIKRMNFNKKELGIIYMFVSRLMSFYKEKKNGIFVKRSAINLLEQYLKNNIISIIQD